MSADDLARILDELGQRLGPTGQHVFELAVRQIVINGIVDCLIVLLSTGVIIGTLVVIRRGIAAEKAKLAANQYATDDTFGYQLFGGLAIGCAVLLALWFGSAALSNLLNPEYAALRDILSAVAR